MLNAVIILAALRLLKLIALAMCRKLERKSMFYNFRSVVERPINEMQTKIYLLQLKTKKTLFGISSLDY